MKKPPPMFEAQVVELARQIGNETDRTQRLLMLNILVASWRDLRKRVTELQADAARRAGTKPEVVGG